MLSDEEKKAIEEFKKLKDYKQTYYGYAWFKVEVCADDEMKQNIDIILNLIEKQSKEIEELKEDRKNYAEEYIHNNPWLYKQLNENYILRVESEQKEKQAYIDGTNVADKLCNKKWKDKIKAKIEELIKEGNYRTVDNSNGRVHFQKEITDYQIEVLQSLLEKE